MLEELISFREAVRLTTYSRPTLNRKIRLGEFPKPVWLDSVGRRVAFTRSSVEAWISARVAEAAAREGVK